MTQPDMVINFGEDGNVEAMHRDGFNLRFLGKQSITRASDIQFDEDSQTWAIHVMIDSYPQLVHEATGFYTYEEARKIEVEWFEQCRLYEVTPTGVIGTRLLEYIKRKKNYGSQS